MIARAEEALPIILLSDKTETMKTLLQAAEELHRAVLRSNPFNAEFYDAVQRGDVATCGNMCVQELANPSAPDERDGLTPLISATKSNDQAMVEFLILQAADVNAQTPADGFS